MDILPQNPVVSAPRTAVDPPDVDKTSLQNEETFKVRFEQLHNNFTTQVCTSLEENRDSRDMIVDVSELQATGKLLPHQTFIAQRIIDTNIARDMPDHISYLTQSRRLAMFKSIKKNSPPDTAELEAEFHRVLTYDNWITTFTKLADSAKLHGFGHVAHQFDADMPGHVSIEFIQAGHLLFDLRVKDIQKSQMVAWVFEITSVDLYEYTQDYGFDQAVSDELARQLDQAGNNAALVSMDEVSRIYRVFFKEKGKVYAGWYSKQLGKYLVKPTEFFNGLAVEIEEMPTSGAMNQNMVAQPVKKWVPIPDKQYPFHFYLNRTTETEHIVQTLGRATLDFYTQEAASSLWSSFVNGCTEAANVMWAPAKDTMDSPSAPKQLTFIVEHGKIWTTPMESFSSPYPPTTLPNALEMLRTQNAEDTNNVSFATNNRKDTRKTATELEMADKQDTVMGTMTVTSWATCLGSIYTAVWPIIQAEALQGKIEFCAGEDGQNNLEYIAPKFKLIPAGTTDFIERMERIQSMQLDMEIVLPTAAGPAFLEEYLRIKYPDNAEKFIMPLQQQAQQSQQQVQVLVTLLQEAVTDEQGNLMPEWQAHAAELTQLGIKAGPQSQPMPGQMPPPDANANP